LVVPLGTAERSLKASSVLSLFLRVLCDAFYSSVLSVLKLFAPSLRAGALVLITLLALFPAFVRAQESFDKRLQHAKDLYDGTKMEEACEAFTALSRENPKDEDTQSYLKLTCAEVKRLQKREEDLYNQGLQLFGQRQYEDARQKFEQSSKVGGLKTFRYHDRAQDYMRKIDDELAKQHAEEAVNKNFDEGERLFKARNYDQAREAFNKVVSAGGPKAGDAGNYLVKIQDALAKQRAEQEARKNFDNGRRLFNARRYDEARGAFTKVVDAGASMAAEAQNYLRKIEEAQKKEVAKNEPPKLEAKPPAKPSERGAGEQATASDDTLRAGLRAYFAGNLEEAERDLTGYLTHHGGKQELAYFFRGAVHSDRYFLSGERDAGEKNQALADFQSAKSRGQGFQPPPAKYISPKILALYAQASAAPSP
jgi:hypothetical protein